MSNLLDDSLVGALLLVSVVYALMALGPRGLKRRMLAWAGGAAARAPSFLRLGKLTQRLETASTAKSSGACGGCDNCGAEESTTNKGSAAEINVPVAKIGRRAAR